MGKTEGEAQDWQCVCEPAASSLSVRAQADCCRSGHVTAITVAPDYRRLGLAKSLMQLLEKVSDLQKAYFVDLFVRVSNTCASLYVLLWLST